MLDLSFWQIFLKATAGVVIVTLHGFAVAAIAVLQGDPGPRRDGRFTLNPFAHVEPFGLATLVFAQVGWARPMTVGPAALRTGRVGMIVCWLGALAASLFVAHALIALRPFIVGNWPAATSIYIFDWLGTVAELTAWFVLVNLLPFPPFTGGLLLALAWPSLYRGVLERLPWVGAALMLGLIVSRGWILQGPLRPLAQAIAP